MIKAQPLRKEMLSFLLEESSNASESMFGKYQQ